MVYISNDVETRESELLIFHLLDKQNIDVGCLSESSERIYFCWIRDSVHVYRRNVIAVEEVGLEEEGWVIDGVASLLLR